jgi:hypothetical protein
MPVIRWLIQHNAAQAVDRPVRLQRPLIAFDAWLLSRPLKISCSG